MDLGATQTQLSCKEMVPSNKPLRPALSPHTGWFCINWQRNLCRTRWLHDGVKLAQDVPVSHHHPSLPHSCLSFASHLIFSLVPLSSAPLPFHLDLLPPFFSSSSSPPSSTAFLLLPWAPSRPGLGARLLTEAPYLGALSVHTHKHTPTPTHIRGCYKKSVQSRKEWAA